MPVRDAPENSSLTIAVGPSRFFHDRVVTSDRREAEYLENVLLSSCSSTKVVIRPCGSARTSSAVATTPSNQKSTSKIDALRLWDDNRDGKLTGAEARCQVSRRYSALTRLIATCVTVTGMVWFDPVSIFSADPDLQNDVEATPGCSGTWTSPS